MAKSNFRVAWDLDEEQKVATATLRQRNEETDEFEDVESEQFDVEAINQAGLGNHLALYGLSKVLQDRNSGTDSGPEKLAAFRETYNFLKQGEWKTSSAGSGGSGGGVPVVVEAIAKLKGISVTDAQASWKDTPKEQKDSIKANEKVQKAMEEVKQERQQTQAADLSDLAG